VLGRGSGCDGAVCCMALYVRLVEGYWPDAALGD